jgi:hypothetical protein
MIVSEHGMARADGSPFLGEISWRRFIRIVPTANALATAPDGLGDFTIPVWLGWLVTFIAFEERWTQAETFFWRFFPNAELQLALDTTARLGKPAESMSFIRSALGVVPFP